MFIRIAKIYEVIPSIASMSAVIVSAYSIYVLTSTVIEYRHQKSQIDKLFQDQANRSFDRDNIELGPKYFVACVGDNPQNCDISSEKNDNIVHESFNCGSDIQYLTSKICKIGPPEISLLRSKTGGLCGYTEVLVKCSENTF